VSLFDSLDEPPIKVTSGARVFSFKPENCPHKNEEKTETDWGKPYGVRMTWTCRDCGKIRGRC